MRAESPWLRRTAWAEECAAWVRGVYAARAAWTPNFEGVQFTLGRAWYTHVEEDSAAEYFAAAPRSDALVREFAPGLQERMLALSTELVGEPVAPRAGWCGAGVHVFPACGWLAQHGGDLHFDTEGLVEDTGAPALSLILMLQPPEDGGGLRVWDARWEGGEDEASLARAAQSPSVTIEYGVGDLVAIDSYRLHQIQPFTGVRDRISATAHLVLTDAGWRLWF
jgi:2OG-Fe(II) oxygenase superfamily